MSCTFTHIQCRTPPGRVGDASVVSKRYRKKDHCRTPLAVYVLGELVYSFKSKEKTQHIKYSGGLPSELKKLTVHALQDVKKSRLWISS